MDEEFVPAFLQKGVPCTLCKAKDTGGSASENQGCMLSVEDGGFFILWKLSNQKEVHILEISHVREVTTGIPTKDTRGATDNESIHHRILTIYHGLEIGNLSSLNFLMQSAELAQTWSDAMMEVVQGMKRRDLSPSEIMMKQWKRIKLPLNSRGLIPVRRLVKHFAHDKNEKVVLQKLRNAGSAYGKKDEMDPQELTFEYFKQLEELICIRDDVTSLFKQICRPGKELIDADSLVDWLNENQRDPRHNEILVPAFDTKRVSGIINKFETSTKNIKNNCLSLPGFHAYLCSRDNPMVYPDKVGIHQDMTQPLCHYFINSSHNTYLTGFQIRGKSSVDIYRHVLLAGCRCIELDCWDGKGEFHREPIVTHGKAMCTDILFKNVLYAIRDSAFVTSEFPVILSFETHCSKPLQEKMAKYCEEVFGELLLSRNLDSHPLTPGEPLPSPHLLRRKILIKNKRLKPDVEKAQLEKCNTLETEESDEASEEAHPEESTEEAHPELQPKKSMESRKLVHTNSDCSQSCISDISIESNVDKVLLKPLNSTNDSKKISVKKLEPDEEEDLIQQVYYEYQQTSATNIHPRLSMLVNYCQSVKFPGFKKDQDTAEKCCYHMSSFGENAGMSYIKTNAVKFTSYNKSQLSRIYPRGNRVDSSNFMPQIFWNAGCQLVSLNFQTSDLGMQLNTAKFEYNGGCGYLLKPEALTQESKSFDCFAESTVDGVIAAQCGVQVISVQHAAERPINTYVEVDMYGLPNDTIRKEFRTHVAMSNGLNPIYNSPEFLFRKVICPDLAMIRFTLYDDSRQLIGQRVAPLSALQTGYRYIGLRTIGGIPLDSTTIFVKINLKSYVPDNFLVIASALENPKAHQVTLDLQHEQQLKRLVDENDSSNNNNPPDVTTDVKPSTKPKKAESSSASPPAPTTCDIVEEDEIKAETTIETLYDHPVYIKSMKRRTKSRRKSSQPLDPEPEESTTKPVPTREATDVDQPSPSCCFLQWVSRTNCTGKKNFSDIREDEESAKKRALLAALQSDHQEATRDLAALHKKEMEELTSQQTRKWMTQSKQFNKNKQIGAAEKERRIRELKAQSVKKFTEERLKLSNKHNFQIEKLEAAQRDVTSKISLQIDKEISQ